MLRMMQVLAAGSALSSASVPATAAPSWSTDDPPQVRIVRGSTLLELARAQTESLAAASALPIVIPEYTGGETFLIDGTLRYLGSPEAYALDALLREMEHWVASAGLATEEFVLVAAPPQSNEADRSSELAARIREFSELRLGWDGYEGQTPSKQTIDNALRFLDLIPPDAPWPTPTVSGDGEVGFIWRAPSAFIDVGLDGSGDISFFAEIGNREWTGAEPFTGASLPRDLAVALAMLPSV